jgi:hypothetical protein
MEFINLTTPANGGPFNALKVDKTNRRRIRIQVMKDFRRKEQQRKVARKIVYEKTRRFVVISS